MGGSESKRVGWQKGLGCVGVQQEKDESRCQLTRLFQDGRQVGRQARQGVEGTRTKIGRGLTADRDLRASGAGMR